MYYPPASDRVKGCRNLCLLSYDVLCVLAYLERMKRPTSMRISTWVMVLVIVIAGGTVRAATGAEYERSDLGYQLDFPGTPIETRGVYTSVLVENAPTHIATVKTNTGIFIATVVDLFEREADGASLMNEAEFFLRLLGDVADVSTTRTPPGRRAVFGRHITIDMRPDVRPEQPGQREAAHKMFMDATGLEVIDGARMTTHMYFQRGRFFIFQGINLPVDGDVRSPDAIRFALSFSWAGDMVEQAD